MASYSTSKLNRVVRSVEDYNRVVINQNRIIHELYQGPTDQLPIMRYEQCEPKHICIAPGEDSAFLCMDCYCNLTSDEVVSWTVTPINYMTKTDWKITVFWECRQCDIGFDNRWFYTFSQVLSKEKTLPALNERKVHELATVESVDMSSCFDCAKVLREKEMEDLRLKFQPRAPFQEPVGVSELFTDDICYV